MKVLEFETSKGRFKLIDMPETIKVNGWNGSIVIDELNQIPQEKYAKGFYLKNITEEQASEIVDEFLFNANDGSDYGDQEVYKNYITDEIYLTNPKESLLSLFKSKGIHLFENPCKDCEDKDLKWFHNELTFYNPYIFKL